MDESTTSDRVAVSKITVIVVRADYLLIYTSSNVVAVVNGTVITIITEEDWGVDTSQNLVTDSISTDGGVITDGRFRPVAMISSRRSKEDAAVDGTGQTIVTIFRGDTDWSKVRAIFGRCAALSFDLIGSVVTRCSTIGWFFDDSILAGLRAVEAVTFGPVGIFVDTRFRAFIDFGSIARLGPVGLVREGTVFTSSNAGNFDVEDFNVGTSISSIGTVATKTFIAPNAINRLTRWARGGVVSQVSTRLATTLGIGGNTAVSFLHFSSTKSTVFSRPLGPWSHDTVSRAAASIARLRLGAVSNTFFTTVLSGLVDRASSGVGGASTGGTTSGPRSPFAIGTINRRASGAVRDGTVTSDNITIEVLATVSEGRAVLWAIDTSSSA